MGINILFDILKYTVSGCLVVLSAYFLLKNRLLFNTNIKTSNEKLILTKDIIVLKLQAFERLTLFIERINPLNIFVRLYEPGMLVKEMQGLILAEIRAEYQHNITQQLYVNTDTWILIKRVKDDTISIVNTASQQLNPEATAVDLSKLVFNRLSGFEVSPYDLALRVIKTEMGEM